jgi:hypothetical protein
VVKTKQKRARLAPRPKERFNLSIDPHLLRLIKQRASNLGLDVNQYVAALAKNDIVKGTPLALRAWEFREAGAETTAPDPQLMLSNMPTKSFGPFDVVLARLEKLLRHPRGTYDMSAEDERWLSKLPDSIQEAFVLADVMRATFPENRREPLKRALLEYYFAEQSSDEISAAPGTSAKPKAHQKQKRIAV